MKRLLIGLLALAPVFTHAVSQKHTATCVSIAELAEALMRYRQTGGSAVSASKVNDDGYEKDGDEYLHEITSKIIIDAYSQPRFYSEESQQRAITEFSNKYYIGCMAMEN